MPTSQILGAEDFRYDQIEAETRRPVDFDTFWPRYHPQDRVAVVSPRLEDGRVATGCALRAM